MPYKSRHAQDGHVDDVAGCLRDADEHRAAVDDQERVEAALDDPAVLQRPGKLFAGGEVRPELFRDPVSDAADSEGAAPVFFTGPFAVFFFFVSVILRYLSCRSNESVPLAERGTDRTTIIGRGLFPLTLPSPTKGRG
jgi:hypothetical protein